MQAFRPLLAGPQAMGENVAAAAAEFCRVLGSPAAGAPPAVPGAFVDFLGVRMVWPVMIPKVAAHEPFLHEAATAASGGPRSREL